MEQTNINDKIQSIKESFKNIRDPHSYEERWDIRSKIYSNEGIYNLHSKKEKLNKKQQESLNEAIDNLNSLHEDLLTKNKNKKPRSDDIYVFNDEVEKLFDHSEFSMRNKINDIRRLFKNIRETLSRDKTKDIRKKIRENVKLYDNYISKKRLNKLEKALFNNAIDTLNKLHEYFLNKSKELRNNDNIFYRLDKLFDYNEYYKPRLIKRSFKGNYVYYGSSGDQNSSIGEYFEKIKFCLNNLI